MTVADRVRDLVLPLLADRDLDLYDVEMAGPVLKVVVDRPGGLDLDALSDATRAVSRALDEADPIAGSYTLEVTSPGLERTAPHPGALRRCGGRDGQGQGGGRCRRTRRRPSRGRAPRRGRRRRHHRPHRRRRRRAPRSSATSPTPTSSGHARSSSGDPAARPGGRNEQREEGSAGHERDDGGAAGARRREGHLGRHPDGGPGRRARVGLQAHAGRPRVRLGDDRPHQLRHPGLRPGDRRGRRALRPRARRHPQGLRPHRRPDGAPGHDPAHPRGRARAPLRGVRGPRGRHRHRHRAAGRQPLHAAQPGPGRGAAAPGRAGAPRAARAQHPAQGLHRRGAPHLQGPPDRRVAHPPGPGARAVQARGARDRRRRGRDQGLRPRARAPHEDRGLVQRQQRRPGGCLRRRPGRPGAAGGQRAAGREDRHRPLQRRPLRVRRQGALPGQGQRGPHRRGHRRRRGHRARLPAVAGHRQGGPERPPVGPADGLAGRHQERDAAGRGRGVRPAGLGRGRVGGRPRDRRAGLAAGRGRARPVRRGLGGRGVRGART